MKNQARRLILLFPAVLVLMLSASRAEAGLRRIKVFVALCDNKTQGIVPVGKKIGNGDDPEANLYWGCSDGLPPVFRRSGRWEVAKTEKDVSSAVMRRLTMKHREEDLELVAEAYRGSEMRDCVRDFEAAAASGQFDLVAFIGHNGLMDFTLPPAARVPGNRTDAVVLCCLSEKYFGPRLEEAGCRPVLMTRQLMYPGAFLLEAAIEKWRKGAGLPEIKATAAAAYSRNQKISVKAAAGVFGP